MIKSENKFLSIRKNNPQNAIVVVGVFICIATVAIIVILNFSAKQKPAYEPHSQVSQPEKEISRRTVNYARFSHAGYTSSPDLTGLR